MFSLSTSWNSAKHKNGFDLVNEIKAIGFDTIELNFALTEKMVGDVLEMKNRSQINVSSLHNICPLPKEIETDEASPDYYSLASPDAEERELAVDVTKNTIDWAKKLGAKAVVLHIGRVQIKDQTRNLAAVAADKKKFEELKAAMIKERERKKDGYLDNAMKSLAELIPHAKKNGISLGIENRYYYREIPIAEELEIILKNFKEGDIYYWHDAGHAEVFERLGIIRHRDILEKFARRLLGIHLHDIIGLIEDHRAPGSGTFDFNNLKSYINKNTIKVIEAHQPATADELKKSLKYLAGILE